MKESIGAKASYAGATPDLARALEAARRILSTPNWPGDAVTVARALLSSAEWQPMETAPRDGTDIDVWVGGEFPKRIPNVSWRAPTDGEWWVHGGDTIDDASPDWFDAFGPLSKNERPTHWMRPPLSPKPQEQSDDKA